MFKGNWYLLALTETAPQPAGSTVDIWWGFIPPGLSLGCRAATAITPTGGWMTSSVWRRVRSPVRTFTASSPQTAASPSRREPLCGGAQRLGSAAVAAKPALPRPVVPAQGNPHEAESGATHGCSGLATLVATHGRSGLGTTTGALGPAPDVPPVTESAIVLNAQNVRTTYTGISSARIVQANIFDTSSGLM